MNGRPFRQARNNNRQEPADQPEQDPIPPQAAPHQDPQNAPPGPEGPLPVVVGPEAAEALAEDLGGAREAQQRDGPPRRQRRRINVDLSDFSTSEDEVELPRRLPRRQNRPNQPAAANPPLDAFEEDDDEDDLLKAVRAKKALAGKWSKSHQGISPGELVILAECRQAFANFPQALASICRLGGAGPLGEFLILISGLVMKVKAMQDALKFKVGVPPATVLLIESTLDILTTFKDKFGPLSFTPSALASLIAFYTDGVFCALYGKEAALEAANQLRSFGKVNRTLSAVSFSSLLKWTNRSNNNSRQNQQSQSQKKSSSSGHGGGGYGRDDRNRGSSMRRNRM